MTNEKKMLTAPVSRLLLSMSLPVIMVMLVNVVYNMADVFFMGREGETLQVAAIALAGPVFSGISAFSTLIGFGACTGISIALGGRDAEKIRKISSFSFYSSIILGAVITALLLIFTDPLLSMLGADGPTGAFAAKYIRILALGSVFMMTGGALGNTVRADGDSKSAMTASITGTLANIALDPLFISVFKWGIGGAAWATVIGNIVSCLMLMLITVRKPAFSLSLKDFTLTPSVSLRTLALGLPMAAGTMLVSFSGMFSNRLLVKYGNIAVAANGVAGKSGMLTCMLIMGICMGIQPAVSYCFGAGEHRRLREIILKTGIFCVMVGAVLGGAFIAFGEGFVRSFVDEPEVTALGRKMVIGSIASAPVYGIYQLCSTYLQGTGRVTAATVTTLLRQGLVLIPVMYAMEGLFGLAGLIFAPALSDVISTAAGVILSLISAKNIKKLANSLIIE